MDMFDQTAAAREAARHSNGQFGEQPHTDPGDVLTVDQIDRLRDLERVVQRAVQDSEAIYREALNHQTIAGIAVAAATARRVYPPARYLTVTRFPDDEVDDFGGYSISIGDEVLDGDGNWVGRALSVSASSSWSAHGEGWMAAVTNVDSEHDGDVEVVDIDAMLRLADKLPADMDRARRQCTRPSMARIRSDIAIEDAMAAEQAVRWLGADGEVRAGTVRGAVWTADGQVADRSTDPRDAHIRITTGGGVDLFMPWEEAATLHETHQMSFRER